MEVRDLGVIHYEAGLRVQDEAVSAVAAKGAQAEVLLVCEHPAVITVGRALGAAQEVFSRDIPVFEVPRGGRATLHLPGQVVIYPILDLKKRGRDLHAYMRLLEDAIIDTLQDFRVTAQAVPGKTGVWTSGTWEQEPQGPQGSQGSDGQNEGQSEDLRKIASIGIAVKNWVSYHGLALNVACDLRLFSNLSPCGFKSNVMTSLIEEMSGEYKQVWAIEPSGLMKRVKKRLVENLVEKLGDGHGT